MSLTLSLTLNLTFLGRGVSRLTKGGKLGTIRFMDFAAIYHFLFETYLGIGVLVGISLVLCVIIAAVLELRTRKTYVDRGPQTDEDEWSFFDDSDDEEE